MRISHTLIVLFVACIGCQQIDESTPVPDISEVAEAVKGSNRFALDLYQQLCTEEGNLFFSPGSLTIALTMTSAGAGDETALEMTKTLRLELPQDQLHDQMHSLQAFWKSSEQKQGIRLNLANRLWGQDGYRFNPKFLRITHDKYDAEIGAVDFAQPEASSRTINEWIENQTEKRIRNLIPAEALSDSTRLVLTNAVYFHGNWSDPFMRDATRDEEFHLTATDSVTVPMMHRWDGFRYGAVDDLQLLELPYGDGSMSMTVFLPKETEGLPQLESNLNIENLERWIVSLKHEDDVRVYLPRFTTTAQFTLSSTLQAMGMKSAFDPMTADFSGIAEDEPIFISAVIHKAFVEVNEEGTVAAAATGDAAASAAMPETEPSVFRADHPFLFMIRDTRNDAILFLGRMMNPLESS